MLIEFRQPDFEFSDDRGGLVQLVREGFRQVNVITSRGSAIRGGHFHRFNKEAFYVISGKFVLSVYAVDNPSSVETYLLGEGDFFMIPPFIAHTFDFKEETILISMYDKGVEIDEQNKDIIAV